MRLLTVLISAVLLVSTTTSTWANPSQKERSHERTWLGEDGNPLPFRTDAKLMEFLRTATVISSKTIGVGITSAQKVELEKDGIRAHAIYRDVDVTRERFQLENRMYIVFRDSYLFECAAYNLAELIGLDNIPPVVLRNERSSHGSLQIWLENTLDKEDKDFAPPNAVDWAEQLRDMYLFDNLIANVDRNTGNGLVDSNYKLWMIDHTRGFQTLTELIEPEKVTRVNRRLWKRLLDLTEDDIRDAVSEYLSLPEIAALTTRRDLLIDHVQKLIKDRGEEMVLY